MIYAIRQLSISTGETHHAVQVRIYGPELVDDLWQCRYEIDWPQGTVAHAGHGVDGIQALVTALQNIANELYASPHHRAGTLIFDKPGNGYGFPITKNGRALLVGDDARFDGN